MKIIDKDDMRLQLMSLIGEKNVVGKKALDAFEEQVGIKYSERIEELVELQRAKTQHKYESIWINEHSLNKKKISQLVEFSEVKNQQRSRVYQFFKLFWKNLYILLRDYKRITMIYFITSVLTILVSLVFLDVGDITQNPQQAYTNRVGLLFIIMAITTFSSLNASAQAFLPLKIIFLKDKESNIYSNSMYFLASVFYIYPVLIPQQIISLILYYFITDLNKDSVS